MITAENVRYYNKALRLLVDSKGTTTYAIEAICNGDAEFAESIANKLIERGFATKYSSMYFNLNQDWKAKEFLKGGVSTPKPAQFKSRLFKNHLPPLL